jgi:predicted ATP-grasp superfamily ATP-dependent carboligase
LLGAVFDPEMLWYTGSVLDRLDWTGPAMVEFMHTPEGEYYLIEVNGRYWGSLPFAIACGVEFPWLHYCQLLDRDPPTVAPGDYRIDIRQCRLLYEDVKWLGERLEAGDIGAVGPFLAAFVRARQTWFSAADPLPTAGAILQAAQVGANDLTRRLVGGAR